MKIPNSLAIKFGRQILVAKKNSPHIFFVAGVVGAVASTVLACRATLKLSKTLDDIQEDLDHAKALKKTKDNIEITNSEAHDAIDYVNVEWRRNAILAYTKGGWKLTKLYGPAIVVGAASVTALTGSHIQLHRRNAALMTAYAAIQAAFDDYRERVRKEVGEEKELDIYHGAETKVVKDADGNDVIQKHVDPNQYSIYSKWFDEGSMHWHKDPEYNRIYIEVQQAYANNLLQARGHVFLNEVYDWLDVGRTKAGAIVGWVKDSEGDNYINFGVYEAFNAAFINGHERSILLDFNVDGVIFDKIGGDSEA